MNMEDNAYNKDRIIGDLLLNEGTFQAWRETMSVHINAEHKRDPAFFRKMIEDLKKKHGRILHAGAHFSGENSSFRTET